MSHWSNTLFWDLETFSAGREIELGPDKFVRQMQYAFGDDKVQTTYDRREMLEIVRSAKINVTHNGISADLTWLFGYDSIEPLYMAMDRKVVDTYYLAHLLTPAPQSFKMRNGRRAVETTDPVGHARSWLGLDNLCFQFDLEGKLGNLKDLAKKYQPEGTKVADYEYGLIDLQDPDFVAYADQDIIAVRSLYRYLLNQIRVQDYPGEYIWREMEVLSATVGQLHRNGILVNQEYAVDRILEQEQKKRELMSWLVEKYDFPIDGAAPWSTSAGKEATLKALADFGFTPENTPEWPLTPKNAPKLGGKDLLLFTQGSEAEEFVRVLGELKGQRSTAQLVLDNTKPDGRVHPEISALQRSGRYSFTKPGVTIFGERTEELRRDKMLFTADKGNVMAGFDFNSADARAMAALSGDREYAQRFQEDENGRAMYDAHNLTGEAVFGADTYYGDGPRDKSARPVLRAASKVVGHSQNYGVGAYKLATGLNQVCQTEGIDLFFWAPAGKNRDGTYKAKPIAVPEKFKHVIVRDTLTTHQIPAGMFLTRDMLDRTNETYGYLTRFKKEAYEEAQKYGYITNPWGRRVHIPEGREYSGGPASYGQSVTTECMKDAILRLIRKGEYYIRSMRAIIHDELLCEFSEDTIERDMEVVKECMEVDFDPKTRRGFPIRFPVGTGFGKTWYHSGH